MIVDTRPLKNKNQTGREMYRLVDKFSGDLGSIFLSDSGRVRSAKNTSLVRYFDFVRNIPYRQDRKPHEVVARPKFISQYGSTFGADCKKKSIMIAAWLNENKIPWRFIAASRRPDRKVHHVFTQGKIDNEWINLDATYKNNQIAMIRNDTKQEVLKR